MSANTADYIVKDISLAEWGRREIEIAETEMPGLMATREEYGTAQPLKGARIAGSLHMTIQTAVLIQTLGSAWAPKCAGHLAIFIRPKTKLQPRSPMQAPRSFAVKGETLEEYWDYADKIFEWPNGEPANMILDDGGDATLLILARCRSRTRTHRFLDNPANEEEEALFATIKRRRLERQPNWYSTVKASIKGVTEETTTGVLRLVSARKSRTPLPFPAINVNDSVTKSKFDNKYGCKESLVDGIRRGTDVMMAGKVALVAGYGDVGKGSAASLAGAGARVMVTEIDPICALQAAMDGFEVVTMEDGAPRADIVITATGNRDVLTADHMRSLKDMAIVGNIGHFDNEIEVEGLRNFKWDNVKDQVDMVTFPDGKRMLLLSQGRLLNLGNATGHPSFVMSASFTNQTLAQIELFTKGDDYDNKVLCVAKTLG